MAIIDSANLKYYLSGGASNADPNASLGGARSSNPVGASINNLYDDVSSAEATSGDTEYRCFYFRNEDANANGLVDPVVWISSNTPSSTTTIAIGLDPAGKNATATTIVDEQTAPAGVSFSSPASKGAGIALTGDPYMQNDYIGIWVRRVVDAGTATAPNDPATVRVEGDSF